MKKNAIIFKILIVLIMLISILQEPVNAGIITDGLLGTYLKKDVHMDIGLEVGKNKDEILSTKGITEKLVGAVQVIGSVISVIALIIIGIRYMFSSVDDKASLKDVLIYYVIGAVLVFATSNILSIAFNVINGLSID